MMNSTICLPASELMNAPEEVRIWVLEKMGLSSKAPGQPTSTGELGLARLSDSQVRQFLSGQLHQRTRSTLRAIAGLAPRFRWADLMHRLGHKKLDDTQILAGVWAGLTKRTRKITGDPKAVLIGWPDWNDLAWEDAVGIVDPETHAAFRRAFGIG